MADLARAEKSLNVSRGLDDQVKGIDAAAAATWRDSRDEELKRQREEIATLEQEVSQSSLSRFWNLHTHQVEGYSHQFRFQDSVSHGQTMIVRYPNPVVGPD